MVASQNRVLLQVILAIRIDCFLKLKQLKVNGAKIVASCKLTALYLLI